VGRVVASHPIVRLERGGPGTHLPGRRLPLLPLRPLLEEVVRVRTRVAPVVRLFHMCTANTPIDEHRAAKALCPCQCV